MQHRYIIPILYYNLFYLYYNIIINLFWEAVILDLGVIKFGSGKYCHHKKCLGVPICFSI